MQIPFDFAQGRLSTPLKYASLRKTGHFLIGTLETVPYSNSRPEFFATYMAASAWFSRLSLLVPSSG